MLHRALTLTLLFFTLSVAPAVAEIPICVELLRGTFIRAVFVSEGGGSERVQRKLRDFLDWRAMPGEGHPEPQAARPRGDFRDFGD